MPNMMLDTTSTGHTQMCHKCGWKAETFNTEAQAPMCFECDTDFHNWTRAMDAVYIEFSTSEFFGG